VSRDYLKEVKSFAAGNLIRKNFSAGADIFEYKFQNSPFLENTMAERTATNAPIQGQLPTADIIKLAIRYAHVGLGKSEVLLEPQPGGFHAAR